jgi:hypothetical protein
MSDASKVNARRAFRVPGEFTTSGLTWSTWTRRSAREGGGVRDFPARPGFLVVFYRYYKLLRGLRLCAADNALHPSSFSRRPPSPVRSTSTPASWCASRRKWRVQVARPNQPPRGAFPLVMKFRYASRYTSEMRYNLVSTLNFYIKHPGN